jgi:hypothetical protein
MKIYADPIDFHCTPAYCYTRHPSQAKAYSKRTRLLVSRSIRTRVLMLLRAVRTVQPTDPTPSINLIPRLESSFVQIKVINRSDPRDQQLRPPGRDAVHERSTHRTEVVLHRVATLDRLALRELGELVAATHVFGLGGLDGEVASEHACGDFSAVGAVADEGVYEAGCFGRLRDSRLALLEVLQLSGIHVRREVAQHHRNMWPWRHHCLCRRRRLRSSTGCL